LRDSNKKLRYEELIAYLNRNMERFPEEFMFQLTSKEFEILKSQIVTSSWGGTRKMPFAFTEYGVAMLSSVLRSKRAIQVNIQVMLVFSKIREMLLDTLSMKLDIEEIKRRLNNQDKNLELVFSYLDELIEKQKSPSPRNQIGFKRKSQEYHLLARDIIYLHQITGQFQVRYLKRIVYYREPVATSQRVFYCPGVRSLLM
jgi:hypothetical protein